MLISRRRLLCSIAASAPALVLPACLIRPSPSRGVWEPDANGPLTIDTHAHFFNASDVAVQGFAQHVLLKSNSPVVREIAGILQFITRSCAPGAGPERKLMAELELSARNGSTAVFESSLDRARQDCYRTAVGQIQEAVEQGALRSNANAPQTANELPLLYEKYLTEVESQADGAWHVERKTLFSSLRFIIEMLQYRTTSFFDYLKAFASLGRRNVDLSLGALVDYDWWLDGWRDPPPTSLSEQVELMHALAVLTRGRVHAWAPFCPLREVAHRLVSYPTFSSLELVKAAVTQHGAIGVKLYPPMGFAAYGNAERQVWAGVPWLPPRLRDIPALGRHLDDALRDLYVWCQAKDVPILAHASATNGPSRTFEKLALAPGWSAALECFEGLRVLFGHFGGADRIDSADHAREFRDLMRSSGPGSHAFADASYFAQALENPDELARTLGPLFEATGGRRSLVFDRFCFGSDWKMLTLERGASQFPVRMDRVVNALAKAAGEVDPIKFSKAFFAGNAVALLGLRKGQKTRGRLDAFYAANDVPQPSWAAKLDV